MIKIDDDIPIPKARNKYPFAQLKVGSSFFADGKYGAICSAARQWAARWEPNARFIVRTVTENGVTGTRIWRIE